ncbi:hypothetical protein R5W24_001536 [Gemmata sp. JC717]|uniref:hypothetical protein n=1 Tax=Gemmata algarum TaxID=2975278 RepID=UPI0021BB7E99|nr:hypothetical protein [Gemmata algarum]MDY3552454.1 hypothetical protein [Gemmata algarum]
MTEAEWLITSDHLALAALYMSAPAEVSERKARLFASACLRAGIGTGWGGTNEELAELDLVERYADRLMTREELAHWYSQGKFGVLARQHGDPWDILLLLLDPRTGGKLIFQRACGNASEFWQQHVFPMELLRDIFGNPFRPVSFDPAWRSSGVQLLAEGIYTDRAWDRLPILADALQEAGCESADLLNHLRDPAATHVRGCWALDLVLGKE